MSPADFFRDKANGAASMVRLVAFVLTLDATAVTAVICVLAVRGARASLLATLTGTVGALVASGVVSLLARARPAPAACPPSTSDPDL